MNPHDETEKPRRRRLQKLPQPRIQLYLIGSFLAISAFSLLLEHMLFVNRMSQLARELPNDGPVFLDRFPGALGSALALTLAACVPLTFVLGALATNRLVGPLQRIEDHLRAVARGERVGELRLRRRDYLVDLAAAFGAALARRADTGVDPTSEPGSGESGRDAA